MNVSANIGTTLFRVVLRLEMGARISCITKWIHFALLRQLVCQFWPHQTSAYYQWNLPQSGWTIISGELLTQFRVCWICIADRFADYECKCDKLAGSLTATQVMDHLAQ
jgi:hypothetical protein